MASMLEVCAKSGIGSPRCATRSGLKAQPPSAISKFGQQHDAHNKPHGHIGQKTRPQLDKIDIKHHHDKQEQHRDRTHIDHHQQHRQKLGPQQHKQRRSVEKSQDQKQHRMHRIARTDHHQRRNQQHR